MHLKQRQIDRFKITGAEVLYHTSENLAKRVPLIDISINTVRFKLSDDFNKREILDMELIIPPKEKIFLKGKAVRISMNNPKDPDSIAVQFSPFGSDKRYNSLNSFKRLNQLIIECEQILEKEMSLLNWNDFCKIQLLDTH